MVSVAMHADRWTHWTLGDARYKDSKLSCPFLGEVQSVWTESMASFQKPGSTKVGENICVPFAIFGS
jgi:hypothetical protein